MNTLASFQRFINKVCREHLNIFIITYLDDILIFFKDYDEHIEHVKKVLKKIKDTKLWLKLKKCKFHIQETEFLGHWITTDGI